MLKLLLARLYRHYRAFSLYLAYSTVMSIVLTSIRWTGTSHLALWACARPVDWVLRYLVIVELYPMVWSRYPGLGTMLKWIALVVFAGAAVLAVLVLWDLFRNPNWRMLPLQFSFAVESVVDWMMAASALAPIIVAACACGNDGMWPCMAACWPCCSAAKRSPCCATACSDAS